MVLMGHPIALPFTSLLCTEEKADVYTNLPYTRILESKEPQQINSSRGKAG